MADLGDGGPDGWALVPAVAALVDRSCGST
jgi:hypothetical protein